jgi:hypothetical protein
MKTFLLLGTPADPSRPGGAPATLWRFRADGEDVGPEVATVLVLKAPFWARLVGSGESAVLAVGRYWLLADEALAAARAGRCGLSVGVLAGEKQRA